MRRAPFGARVARSERNSGCLDVGRLQALVALDDLELDLLTLGQGLIAVHVDRGEVHEHVVTLLALDEPVALLVREPLHGALSQLASSLNVKRRPGHRAADLVNSAGTVTRSEERRV